MQSQPKEHQGSAAEPKRGGSWWTLGKELVNDWSADNVQRQGAALAYYSAFSIAPLLVIALAVSGLALGHESAQNSIDDQLRGMLGDRGTEAVESMIAAASKPQHGIIATIVGVVALLFGALGVFGELQASLNDIWHVAPKPGRDIWQRIKDRLWSFAMVAGTGFLLLVSLIVNAVLAAMEKWWTQWLPGPEWLGQIVNFCVSLTVITLLFATIFKVLPDVKLHWSDVWIGAGLTAILFTIGKFLLGLYLGRSAMASSYGAAGSFIIVLLWVYYSSQILFAGVEFTKVYARKFGSGVRPADDAVLDPSRDEN
jgi:membrane protein